MRMPGRFWSKVYKTGECWWWIGSVNRGGYGQFWLDNRMRTSHRVAYELAVGPIPDGLQLDHLCRNTACVRPEHLEPVTSRENLMRGDTLAAAAARRTHCTKGHPYDEANTYHHPVGERRCRICQSDRARAANKRKSLARSAA